MKQSLTLVSVLILAGCGQQPAEQGPEPPAQGRWYSQALVQKGAPLFQEYCAVCHGAQAQGLAQDWRQPLPDGTYPPPPLDGSAHAWHHPLAVLQRTIRLGGAPVGGQMPAFGEKLDEEERLAIIAWFQEKWNDDIYALWYERSGIEPR
ncbi:MAG: c-type cytochrome [Gammaproteobacteria bacterium]|jgi:mono/diheme cytochrome c family protein